MTTPTAELIARQAARMVRLRHVHGAVLAVDQTALQEPRVAAAGDLAPESRFCAASTTKLVVTIAVIRLVERGEIGLDDPM